MYKGLNHLHSLNRYIILALLLTVIISSFMKWRNKSEYTKTDNKLNLFTFISAHLQLTIGFILYFWNKSDFVNFDSMFKDGYRFFTVEHTLGMVIAIALITIGRIKGKKITNSAKRHKTTFIYFLIALIVIIASIPWPFRNVGVTSWF